MDENQDPEPTTDMFRTAGIAILLALFAFPGSLAAQAEFAGQWEMTRETPRGTMTQLFTLVYEDGEWSGTMSMREREIELSDIEIDGDQITFKMSMPAMGGRGGRGGEGRGGGMTPTFTGTLEGDEIRGEMSGGRGMGGRGGGGGGGGGELVLRRVEAS